MWHSRRAEDIRDAFAFALGAAIIIFEAFIADPPLDRPGLLLVAIGLMGYGAGRWNGRHKENDDAE